MRLDGTLGEFFAVLDSAVGRDRYAIGLSADHGVARIPEAVRAEEATLDASSTRKSWLAEAAMTAAHGAGPHVALVEHQPLPHKSGPGAQGEGPRYIQPIIDAVSKMPGIQRVFSSRGLENKRASTDPIERAAALGHHPEESGEVTVILKPNWIGTNTSTTTHGSAQPYDQHVPVVFLGSAQARPLRHAGVASRSGANVGLAHQADQPALTVACSPMGCGIDVHDRAACQIASGCPCPFETSMVAPHGRGPLRAECAMGCLVAGAALLATTGHSQERRLGPHE